MNSVLTHPDLQEAEVRDAERKKRVCFVCTGNTCRSPMAEAYANDLAQKKGLLWEAHSAGLYAEELSPISQNAVLALEKAGVEAVAGRDYRLHLAHTLTEKEAEDFDLLVGMTPHHAFEMTLRYPAMASRIVSMPQAIPDPFGMDESAYLACLEEIQKGVRALLFPEDAE